MMLVVITLLAFIYIFKNDGNAIDDSNGVVVFNQKPVTITITRDNTHIRNGPSTDHDIISFAKQNSVYTIISESNDWYEIDLDGTTGFIWKSFIQPHNMADDHKDILKNKVIILDAGHGGHDVGAIGATGTFEKDLTYKTTKLLEETLDTLDAHVLLTREDDQYIRLGSRTSFANMHDADVFISIHYNSFPEQEDITGIGTYYYHDRSQYIAQHIQHAIARETHAENRGVDVGNFQVLRENVNPAVLVELGFISNSEQERRLLKNDYQEMLVKGMVKGLIHYFREQEKR